MPNDLEYAYLAGLFDADGSICLLAGSSSRGKHTHVTVHAYIAAQDVELIEWLKVTFGGRSHKMGRILAWFPLAPPHLTLEQCLPYMHTKKSQVELVLEYKQFVKEHFVGVDDVQSFAQRSKDLNGRLPKLYPKAASIQTQEEVGGNPGNSERVESGPGDAGSSEA